MNDYDNIPDLSEADNKFLDSISDKITKKYLAQGGAADQIKPYYMDHVLTMMFYIEGRQAVLHYARDYTYNPAQKIQPVYIERYANNNLPEMPKKPVHSHVRGADKNQSRGSNQNQRRCPIYCDGMIYNTIKECASAYDVHASNMCAWLNGKNKMPSRFVDMGLRYAN